MIFLNWATRKPPNYMDTDNAKLKMVCVCLVPLLSYITTIGLSKHIWATVSNLKI